MTSSDNGRWPETAGGEEPTFYESEADAAADEEALARILSGEDFGVVAEAAAPPLYWPGLPSTQWGDALADLYVWVVRLQNRYREMVRLPLCWYRHNSVVELLSALRDYERAAYSETAAPTAAMQWQLAFRDCETRLRSWLADLRCGGDPYYHDERVHMYVEPDITIPPDLVRHVGQAVGVQQAVAAAAAGQVGPVR